MNHAIDLAVGSHYFQPGLRIPPYLSPDGATCKGHHTSNSSLLLIYRSSKDERLSWPSWLTCSGWFTDISGHPSAAGRAQDRESSPTTVPRHQLYDMYECEIVEDIVLAVDQQCTTVPDAAKFASCNEIAAITLACSAVNK